MYVYMRGHKMHIHKQYWTISNTWKSTKALSLLGAFQLANSFLLANASLLTNINLLKSEEHTLWFLSEQQWVCYDFYWYIFSKNLAKQSYPFVPYIRENIHQKIGKFVNVFATHVIMDFYKSKLRTFLLIIY